MPVESTSEQSPTDEVLDVHETTCCVVGGGPGGVMLALLLARRGVPVTLLEAHPTFDRDFRGDTIDWGILEMLDEIGLADRLHQVQHVKMYGPTFPTADGPVMLFDFRGLLKTRFPYIMWVPQHLFLEFLAEEAKKYPTFRLVMGANVQRLVEENGVVRGVRYRGGDGWHEVRATLTVAADGRYSRVRKMAGFQPIPTSAPVELLWFHLPRLPSDPEGTGMVSPRFAKGHILIMIDRADHWQVGYFFPVGNYQKLRMAGVEAMRQNIITLEPRFAPNVEALTDWQQFTLLSVSCGRCRRWHKPGLLLIGDAAHPMTPGAGINLAINDAVVAARVLTSPLLAGRVCRRDLAEVQRQREWPTRLLQALSAFGVRQYHHVFRTGKPIINPHLVKLLFRLPILGKIFASLLVFLGRGPRIKQ